MGELPEDRMSVSLSDIHHTLLSDVIGEYEISIVHALYYQDLTT